MTFILRALTPCILWALSE